MALFRRRTSSTSCPGGVGAAAIKFSAGTPLEEARLGSGTSPLIQWACPWCQWICPRTGPTARWTRCCSSCPTASRVARLGQGAKTRRFFDLEMVVCDVICAMEQCAARLDLGRDTSGSGASKNCVCCRRNPQSGARNSYGVPPRAEPRRGRSSLEDLGRRSSSSGRRPGASPSERHESCGILHELVSAGVVQLAEAVLAMRRAWEASSSSTSTHCPTTRRGGRW